MRECLPTWRAVALIALAVAALALVVVACITLGGVR